MTKEHSEQKKNPLKILKSRKELMIVLRVVLLAVIFGVLAGGIGALFTYNYLSDYSASLAPEPSELQKTSPTARIVSPGTIESAVEIAKQKVVPAMVVFYEKKSAEADVYFENEILGYGIVFTSDGWLIAPGEIFSKISAAKITARADNKYYDIEKKLADKVTGMSFVKISAENLAVAEMTEKQYVESGDRVVAVMGNDFFEAGNILSKHYNPLSAKNYLQSSEEAATRLLIGTNFKLGAPTVNYEGKIIGLMNSESGEGALAVPCYYLNPLMKSLLKEEKLIRPYLGLNYIDLARASVADPDIAAGKNQGALVWSGADDEPPAVLADSPAASAEIQKGDIITSVNGEIINSHGSLAEILLDYNPQNRLFLEILRNGETQTVSATLGSYDSLAK